MKTIEEVLVYLQKKMKQCDDLITMYKELYENAIDKKSKKVYKSLINDYNARWLGLAIALDDIKG